MFPVWIYFFAVFRPIGTASPRAEREAHYLETNGILDALLFYALGVVIYVVMRARSPIGGRRLEDALRRDPARLTASDIATRLYVV